MTDNKTLPFTGDGDATSTVATDEIGGVDFQRVKFTLGADGVNDGDVSDENPLPAKTAVVAHGRLTSLMQTRRDWRSILVKSNGDVIACVYGGGIYLQTAGVGDFVDTGEASRNWVGLCEAPNGDVYASVYSGDIYVQTGGAGSFVGLGGTSRGWWGMCVNPANGDVYAVVYAGDIYVRAGGSGSFTAIGGTTRNWLAICADSVGNVWATADTGIYKRPLGSGSFYTISVPSTIGVSFTSIAVARDGSYLFAAASDAQRLIVIPVQYDLVAIPNVAQQLVPTAYGIAISDSGKMYVTTAYFGSPDQTKGEIMYADLGFVSPGDFVKPKVNRNGAQAVCLEDWDMPGRGVRVGDFGGVRAETGHVPHDYPAKESVAYAEVRPTLVGGYASAAAPTDVSADGDAVRAWHLRNGAQATVLTAAGALIGGDATNGLDVDVTRVPTDPFGANADAAVVTDASGSISAKIRGLVKLLAEKISVYLSPSTSGGLSSFAASAAPSGTILQNTPRAVKSGAGQLYGWYIYNPESAVSFVHFWDAAVGSVTVGSTAPKFTLPIPAGGAANVLGPHGIPFATAITVAATTTAGGSTSPATGVTLTAFYF